MIDAHLHLDQYKYEELPVYIEKWQQQGIEKVAAVSTDLRSSYKTLELASRFPDFVLPCIGFHPEQKLPPKREVNELLLLIKSEHTNLSAVGEIGLPHYMNNISTLSSLQPYIELLEMFLGEAKRFSLPVVLHAVHDKASLTYDLLLKYEDLRAHFHWLKAEKKTLHSIIDAGYYISVTPEVCYRERDQQLVREVPLTQLMIETDGPWPFKGVFEARKTTPLFLKEMTSIIAEIKNTSSAVIKDTTKKNTMHFYQRNDMK